MIEFIRLFYLTWRKYEKDCFSVSDLCSDVHGLQRACNRDCTDCHSNTNFNSFSHGKPNACSTRNPDPRAGDIIGVRNQ